MRLIIILLCLYMIYKITTKWIFPLLVKRFIRKTQESFFENNPNLQKERRADEKGKVIIKTPLKKRNKLNIDNLGDYTDFEEIGSKSTKK